MLRLSFVHGLSFAPVRADCYFRLFSCVCVGVRVHNGQTGEIPVDEFVSLYKIGNVSECSTRLDIDI